MFQRIKQLLCKHNYMLLREKGFNLTGDYTIRRVYKCKKCKKIVRKDEHQ